MKIAIHSLSLEDPRTISAAFAAIGWSKSPKQFERYLAEQSTGTRLVRVASVDDRFVGYVTVLVDSEYPFFKRENIPEISDLNVLPDFRKMGIATRLLDECETWIASRSPMAGIGVGLHPGYNAAQRLYVKRGFVPDGRGVTTHGRNVEEGESVPFDDDLVLWMIKTL